MRECLEQIVAMGWKKSGESLSSRAAARAVWADNHGVVGTRCVSVTVRLMCIVDVEHWACKGRIDSVIDVCREVWFNSSKSVGLECFTERQRNGRRMDRRHYSCRLFIQFHVLFMIDTNSASFWIGRLRSLRSRCLYGQARLADRLGFFGRHPLTNVQAIDRRL